MSLTDYEIKASVQVYKEKCNPHWRYTAADLKLATTLQVLHAHDIESLWKHHSAIP